MEGGKKLKRLRNRRKLSQLDVYLRGGVIAQKTLSHIETGKTHPKRETIENLLAFYDASFDEVQDVLQAYGYRPVAYPLPVDRDIAVILEQVQPILDAAPVPAYCVDYISRLLAYNRLLLRLSGWERTKMERLKGKPLWQSRIEHRIASGEATDPALLEEVGQTRQQLHSLYLHEPWFEAFIETCGEPFLTYWREAARGVTEQEREAKTFMPSAGDAFMEPVPFNVPGVPQSLSFMFYQERLESDSRIRLMYLWPAHREASEWLLAQHEE